jgi:hypothetical protein
MLERCDLGAAERSVHFVPSNSQGVGYLPKRIRVCPRCRDSGRVQHIVYGFPAFVPSEEEEDRVYFEGCIAQSYDKNPSWYCPACDTKYTGRGEIVTQIDDFGA